MKASALKAYIAQKSKEVGLQLRITGTEDMTKEDVDAAIEAVQSFMRKHGAGEKVKRDGWIEE